MALGRTLCLLFASAALAGPAFAQTPTRGDARASSFSDRWKDHRAEWEARRQARERQRAADIALLLRLKPDQQAAFQAMEASMRPPEGERGGWKRESDAATPLTTAQALDRMQTRMSEHEARMRAHLDATRRFYAALSPEQQGLFDALLRLRHEGGEGGRGGHGGGPMRRGEGRGMSDAMAPPPASPGL